MPEVSVVIATYKRPVVLQRAVRSALDQTFADLEIVVVAERDDPETVAAVESLGDARARVVINPEKRGPAAARDFGVASCLGHWVAFLDDDDHWEPEKLALQLASVTDRDRTISTTLTYVVTSSGTLVRPSVPYDGSVPIDEWLFDRRSWFGGGAVLQTSSLMAPRALFGKVGFGNAFHEEWEFVIRAVKEHGCALITVPKPLVTYYVGGKYPWRQSAEWVIQSRDVLTPRAISGFCLTVAPQGLAPADRAEATKTFVKLAYKYGRPTPQQLFAFALITALPHGLRKKIRALVGRRSGEAQAAQA
jgi:glycosyltransferase involved in cell wall biosynthesis